MCKETRDMTWSPINYLVFLSIFQILIGDITQYVFFGWEPIFVSYLFVYSNKIKNWRSVSVNVLP